MEHYNMNLTLKVWKQKNSEAKGRFETFQVKDISSEMSFLEMFDVLNEKLIAEGVEPITFDHDCREGICGACSMYIDGQPHGPWEKNT
ncbi:MAG TPA: 2Fe-2S iron-sulfur cluster-binding protein, partial [Ferruginibacter sp.]|nr:2Fe-2S iron-sulfur cluster-binding protein [Ferruginibacter sp.]